MTVPISNSLFDKLYEISSNPITLFDEKERQQLTSQALKGDIAGLNNDQKISLANKINLYLINNKSFISTLENKEGVVACINQLKKHVGNLDLTSAKLEEILKTLDLFLPVKLESSSGKSLTQSHGTFSFDMARKMLEGKPKGTFLIRNSDIYYGVKIINFVDEAGKIQDFRLVRKEKGYSDIFGKEYQTLEQFISTKKEFLKFNCLEAAKTDAVVSDEALTKSLLESKQGHLTPEATYLMLKGKPAGLFLLRNSIVYKNELIFNYVAKSGSIKEFRLNTHTQGYEDKSGNLYASLEQFLKTKSDDLKIPYSSNFGLIARTFQGKISPAAALGNLKGMPTGTYLVRESDTHSGVIIFNYVASDGKVKEFRCFPHDGVFTDKAGKTYANLDEAFESIKSELRYPWLSASDKIVQAMVGEISKDSAMLRLKGNLPGTYLIRDDEAKKEVKIIDYVDTDSKIKEVRLFPHESGYRDMIGKTYSSLEHFIETRAQSINIPYKRDDIYGMNITKFDFGMPSTLYRGSIPYDITLDPNIIADLKDHHITNIVLLCSDAECERCTGIDLKKFYQDAGLQVLQFPIPDFEAPPIEDLRHLLERIQFWLSTNDKDHNTLIHCRAGRGRTGMVLACLARKVFNFTPEQAIEWVRKTIPGAIDVPSQIEAIRIVMLLRDIIGRSGLSGLEIISH